MIRIARILTLCLVGTVVRAETLQPVPTSAKDTALLYSLFSIHEAKTPTDLARVFGISVANEAKIRTMLQITADDRLPQKNKLSRIFVWELNTDMRTIYGVKLNDTIVTVDGWGYEKGSITCSYRFHHSNGMLVKGLEAIGCRSSRT